eukprot:3938975-Rhodomonas_salina.1
MERNKACALKAAASWNGVSVKRSEVCAWGEAMCQCARRANQSVHVERSEMRAWSEGKKCLRSGFKTLRLAGRIKRAPSCRACSVQAGQVSPPVSAQSGRCSGFGPLVGTEHLHTP